MNTLLALKDVSKSHAGVEARILIMDEPTASLAEQDADHLFGVIRELRSQGVGIVYISHRLDELFQAADRVTVLRDGRGVGTRPMAEVTRDELIRLMVGREISAVFPKREALLGVLLLASIGSALVFLGVPPQWEKAVQGVIILVAVASDALNLRLRRHAGAGLAAR
jgi:rhamnose transport system ATP-binding protein